MILHTISWYCIASVNYLFNRCNPESSACAIVFQSSSGKPSTGLDEVWLPTCQDMSASRLSASMMRMGLSSRATSATMAGRPTLPCTCRAFSRRLQSSMRNETTPAGEAAPSGSTSGTVLSATSSSSAPPTGQGSSARIAQESFRRQQSRARPLPVIKVRFSSVDVAVRMQQSYGVVDRDGQLICRWIPTGSEEIIPRSCGMCNYGMDIFRAVGNECWEGSIDRYA